MKKKLLFAIALFGMSLGVNAQLSSFPYDSGLLGPQEVEKEMPEWMKVTTDGVELTQATLTERTGLAADRSEAFYAGVGIPLGTTSARGIKLSKSDGNPGSALVLNLTKCGTVTATAWGTGGRGLEISNSVNASKSWAGAGSYTVVEVSAELNIDQPVTVYLKPTGNSEGSVSTGDTFIGSIKVTAPGGGASIIDIDFGKIPASVQYYNLLGAEVDENTNGFVVVKTTYEDGSVSTSKVFNN